GLPHLLWTGVIPAPPEAPPRTCKPAGQDHEGASRARNGHSTALFADECQSFLDNVIARLGQTGSWNNPHLPAGLTSTAKLNREYECLVRFESITRVSSPNPRRGHFPNSAQNARLATGLESLRS